MFGESTADQSVVGTYFFNALYYATSRDILTSISQATVVYNEGNECPPYKIQGKQQNSALDPGVIKVGNNQGITTSCPSAGARLW
ncbi:MAG TPA: hypothetical protein VNI77_03795 [Nitrososphaera sp.]|nr:hypothetical protein [Nitrososphaera sp.]